jgi:flagellar biosynthesis anti-sigma factor FlgM
MRIDNPNLNPAGGSAVERAGAAAGIGSGTGRPGGVGGATDSVQLSNLSEAVRFYSSPAADAGRAERIAELTAQLAAGQYQINGIEVARGLMNEAMGPE